MVCHCACSRNFKNEAALASIGLLRQTKRNGGLGSSNSEHDPAVVCFENGNTSFGFHTSWEQPCVSQRQLASETELNLVGQLIQLYTLDTVHYNILLKKTNEHNAQLSIYSFTSLHLHVSVSVDHFQGACSNRVHQLKQHVLTSTI